MGSAMHRAVKRPHKLVLLRWVSPSASTPLRATGARPPWEKKNLPPQRGLRSLSPDYDFETVSMDRDVISVVLPGNTVFFSYAARSRSFHLLYLLCSSSREVGLHLPRAAAPLCSFRGGSWQTLPHSPGEQHPSTAPSPQLLGIRTLLHICVGVCFFRAAPHRDVWPHTSTGSQSQASGPPTTDFFMSGFTITATP